MRKLLSGLFLASLAASLMVGGCRPKYPNCKNDDHCNEGEYCVNNKCQQCRDNGDCPEGQECAAGACRDIPGYCQQTEDCAAGQVCRDNRCGPCMDSGDCAEDQVCLDGACTVPECRSTEDCPAGLSCINYRCATGEPLSASSECSIEPVYFEFDSAEVDRQARRTLEQMYRCLENGEDAVRVVGFTDPRGTTEYNLALGERRARMVDKVLTTLGMDANRTRIVSKGEEEATGYNEETWAKDRRVELK